MEVVILVLDMGLLELQVSGTAELLYLPKKMPCPRYLFKNSNKNILDFHLKEVATEVAKNEKVIDQMPGVLVKAEDGSLKKIVTPGVEMPLPDFKPEPTR